MSFVGKVSLLDIVLAFSEAMDFVSPALNRHHHRVAYIAAALARKMELPKIEQDELVLAGALHDCGAFTLQERIDLMTFEESSLNVHAERGARLLEEFRPFSRVATLVRHHHAPWGLWWERPESTTSVPFGSHILHLADRVSVLVQDSSDIFRQGIVIRDKINQYAASVFHPDCVDAFNSLVERESFWLDISSPEINHILVHEYHAGDVPVTDYELKGMAALFLSLIDFRSRFTSTHSSGVAAVARTLAERSGMSADECDRMETAAALHDLGKLSVPVEILEKNAGLDHHEQVVMRCHTYHGFRILDKIPGMEEINTWANYHHERMNGHGYPFHLNGNQLSLGSRIMAVADVFTALTEDRPYREGLDGKKALTILSTMANGGSLDPELVDVVSREAAGFDAIRAKAQTAALRRYQGHFGSVDSL